MSDVTDCSWWWDRSREETTNTSCYWSDLSSGYYIVRI